MDGVVEGEEVESGLEDTDAIRGEIRQCYEL